MSTQTETLKLALEALETLTEGHSLGGKKLGDKAITAIKEALAQPEQETVSKARYNKVRDDYNELFEKSQQDAKDAKEWRKHVTHCQLQGVDLDHNFAPTAQPKEPEQEPVAWEYKAFYIPNPQFDDGMRVTRDLRVAQVNGEPNTIKPLLYITPQPMSESHKRKPLDNQNPLLVFAKECVLGAYSETELADAAFRAIEAAHGIKK